MTDFEVNETGTRKILDEKDMEIQRLREGLRRLASPEAFVVVQALPQPLRAATEEEKARMKFAEELLNG